MATGVHRQNLIYMLCFGGETYRRMVDLCIESLREWGLFTGGVVVFTDGSYRTNRVGVETVEVGKPSSAFDIMCSKPRLAALLPAERYAQVAVMDADIIAISDVNGLFCADGSRIVGMAEYPFNTMLAESCGGAHLSPSERHLAGQADGINTGFLCMAGTQVRASMRMWHEEIVHNASRRNEWADQPYFNVLVLRRRLAFRALPRYWIDMPSIHYWMNGSYQLQACTRLLHFSGRPQQKLWLMKETVRALRLDRCNLESAIHDAWVNRPRSKRGGAAGVGPPLRGCAC